MTRPTKLAVVGCILVLTVVLAPKIYQWSQKPVDANWTVTQKRMAELAEFIPRPSPQPYEGNWPDLIDMDSLWVWAKSTATPYWRPALEDEWGRPLRYKPYGIVSDHPSRVDVIGEQILDPLSGNLGTWIRGGEGWEPLALTGDRASGWQKKLPRGARQTSSLNIRFIEIVSLGRDGQPGGRGQDRDIVLRMSVSDDSNTTKTSRGWEQKVTHSLKCEFIE